MSVPPMKLECPPFDLTLQKLLHPDTTPKDLLAIKKCPGQHSYTPDKVFLFTLVQVVGPKGPPGPMVTIYFH